MKSAGNLARPDLFFALAACIFSAFLFQPSVFGDACDSTYRFRSLPFFAFMPLQLWIATAVLTAFMVPAAASWAFRAHPKILYPAIGQALLLLLQIAIEAAFGLNERASLIPLIGAIFSLWRIIRFLQLRAEVPAPLWKVVFALCAAFWATNLSLLLIVIWQSCLA